LADTKLLLLLLLYFLLAAVGFLVEFHLSFVAGAPKIKLNHPLVVDFRLIFCHTKVYFVRIYVLHINLLCFNLLVVIKPHWSFPLK